jgi:hypothetical protein
MANNDYSSEVRRSSGMQLLLLFGGFFLDGCLMVGKVHLHIAIKTYSVVMCFEP